MLKMLRAYRDEEDGAVTVDWVVLTAAVIGINVFLVVNIIEVGIEQNASYIDSQINTAASNIRNN